MSSTFSPNLNLQYQGVGDNSNTWGTTLNTSVFVNIDQALGSPFTVSVAGSTDYTISATNALNFYHNPTGILTGNISYIFPASCARILLFKNSTTGSFSLTVKSSGGTGVVVPQGAIVWVYINSTGNVASLPFGTTTEQNLASASTCDLGSTGSNMVLITGTTTITALGSSAVQTNPVYFVRFNGVLTLTYNATSLILPGAASITTAANDSGIFEYQGSGNWQCLMYQKANGQAVVSTSNAPFIDSTAIIKGSSDATKLLRIEVDGFTTGTTRVLTPPNFDGTIATLAGTETFTGKTIAGGSNTISGITETMLSTSDITTLDCSTSKHGFLKKLPNNAAQFMNGVGSWAVPVQAWCNIDASSGTPTDVESINVTSYTDIGVGVIQVNFTSTLRTANYMMAGSASGTAAGSTCVKVTSGSAGGTATTKTTSACSIAVGGAGSSTDSAFVGALFL